MLTVIEDIRRILRTSKNNITIGSVSTDNISETDVKELIRDVDSIIYAKLRAKFTVPFKKRILLPSTTPAATLSTTNQPLFAQQLEVVVRGTGTLTSNNAITITGTDKDGVALVEVLNFIEAGSQATENCFKTINTSGIACASSIISLTGGKILILSYDILSYISQRWSAYNVYRECFSANSPNEIPAAIREWRKEAMDLLQEIIDGKIFLEGQVSISPLSERPFYNTPLKFFKNRGVVGIEELSEEDEQDDDDDVTYSE